MMERKSSGVQYLYTYLNDYGARSPLALLPLTYDVAMIARDIPKQFEAFGNSEVRPSMVKMPFVMPKRTIRDSTSRALDKDLFLDDVFFLNQINVK